MHALRHTHSHSIQNLTHISYQSSASTFISVWLEMKEIIGMSKRGRVYCVETGSSSTGFTSFCVKYLTYLLQALMRSPASIEMSRDKNEEQHLDVRKRVRFEIDMAMVVTVGTHHFKWTQTLKQKLEYSCHWSTGVAEMPEQVLQPIILVEWHHVPSSVNYVSIEMGRRRSMEKGGERVEARRCIDLLRELVAMGDEECSVEELMEEVASYVTSLQFQVGALRALLSTST